MVATSLINGGGVDAMVVETIVIVDGVAASVVAALSPQNRDSRDQGCKRKVVGRPLAVVDNCSRRHQDKEAHLAIIAEQMSEDTM